MPYILLAVLTFGFSSGYGVAYKVMKSANLELENQIAVVNAKVQEQAKRIKQSELDAIKLNEELSKTHEKNITTINSIKHGRLYDNRATCRVSKGSNSERIESASTGTTELSKELTEYLWGQSAKADRLTVERNSLLTFVKSNCGVK